MCLIVWVPLSVEAGLFSSFFTAPETNTEDEIVYAIGSNAQTLPLLKAALHTDPNPAKGGGDILIDDGTLVPSGSIESTESDTSSPTANGEISLYIVREADTLSQIAEMFDVSEKTILWANDIRDPSIIQPGDTLVILPITGVRHVVKKGDTIGSIAKKYSSDVNDILKYNQLSSADDISVGDTIVVPGGEISTPTPTQTHKTTSSHTVVATGNGSSGYIPPLTSYVCTQGIHGYNGVDLAAPVGTPIRAAASGQVIVAKTSGWNGGYGLYVVIRHPNGTQTLYAHMSSDIVRIGQNVVAGQVIGYVGVTGRSTGPHLHFEVRGARNPFTAGCPAF